jgi:putative ABC transport system permease protein
MDAGTAKAYGFSVGQRVRVLLAGPAKTFTISGIAQYGTAQNLAGSTLAAFTLPVAENVLQRSDSFGDILVVATPGADRGTVQRDIAALLPPGVQVVTGQTAANEEISSVAQGLSFFSSALLIFALISLFVGGFTIFNTFAIIVGQRTRELALLRVIGASRGQIFGSVLAEAAVVGLAASAIGVGLGVLAATGLRVLIGEFGISLPAGPLVFEPRTAVVGLAVGTGVALVSAIGPASNAVRVPPVAALSGRGADGDKASGRWPIGGTILALAGLVLLGLGLSRPVMALVGAGAACVFLGIAMLTPTLARPLSSVIGRPLARALGEPGRLGRENSMCSPRRTARTASALMVGLAPGQRDIRVWLFAIAFGHKQRRRRDQGRAHSDADRRHRRAQYARASHRRRGTGCHRGDHRVPGQFEAMNSLVTLTAAATAQLADTTTLNITAGSSSALDGGELLIDTTTARQQHLSVGDKVPVKFSTTGPTVLYIGGIFEPNSLIGSYLVSDTLFLAHFTHPLPIVNQLIGLVYALLALAVLIALIGIMNTLMLTVLERTREIGLLRAIGMLRGQVRAMVRSEAVIMAIFGAITGIAIGTPMGLALVSAASGRVTQTAVPVNRLVIFLVLSAFLGLVAASWPARRAASLDVLAAIAER